MKGVEVKRIVVGSNGILWILTSRGVWQYAPGSGKLSPDADRARAVRSALITDTP